MFNELLDLFYEHGILEKIEVMSKIKNVIDGIWLSNKLEEL